MSVLQEVEALTKTFFSHVPARNEAEMARLIQEGINPNALKTGATPLSFAMSFKEPALRHASVEKLLADGANPHLHTIPFGWRDITERLTTPLEIATAKQDKPVVELLEGAIAKAKRAGITHPYENGIQPGAGDALYEELTGVSKVAKPATGAPEFKGISQEIPPTEKSK